MYSFFFFKISKKIGKKISQEDVFQLQDHKVSRNNKIKISRKNIHYRRVSYFTNRLVEHWNRLPHDMINIDIAQTLRKKKRLDDYLEEVWCY